MITGLLPLGDGREVQVISTERVDGDFAINSSVVSERRSALMSGDWTWLALEHGSDLVTVTTQGEHAGARADGAWTYRDSAILGVTSADCAPVVLAVASEQRAALGIVHAGWRGLVAGIIETAAASLTGHVGAAEDCTAISYCGPCIGPDHYEFSEADLALVTQRYGERVATTTASGAPALDLFAGVATALHGVGFPVPDRPPSTASDRFFSHRVRRDPQRMTTVARMVVT